MRLAGLRSLLLWAAAVVMAGAVAGCDNPFDPLDKSDKIEGLTYFDFAATQEHWDSDPEWDGLQLSLAYYNEFGTQLNFHDKPHRIEIEIWSEESSGDPPVVTRSYLITKTVEFTNSDDLIRIPVEYYAGFLSIADPPESITGYLVVRVFPPQGYPQAVLEYFPVSVDLYTAEEVLIL